MGHYPSSGMPYADPSNPDTFDVKGEPKKVPDIGKARTEDQDAGGDAARAELGAGVKTATRSASESSMGRVSIPTEPEGLSPSPYNRKG